MNQDRIDGIARALAGAGSRRRALGMALGGAGAALLGRAVPLIAAQGQKCRRAGESCADNGRCCSGKCQAGTCVAACGDGEARCAERCCGRGERCQDGRCVERSAAAAKPTNGAGQDKPKPQDGAGHGEGHGQAAPAYDPATAADDDAATGDAGMTCAKAGEPCTQDGRCCSKRCVDGTCRAKQKADAAPEGRASRASSSVPGSNKQVLLALYNHRAPNAGTDYSRVTYRPRRFTAGHVIDDPTRGQLRVDNPGAYAGWDILTTFNWSVHRAMKSNNWLELRLNRDTVAAVVWRGGSSLPSWLKGWTKAGDVVVGGKAFPTYRRSLKAGPSDLGAVYGASDSGTRTRDTYWVLFAERDGLPSPEPTVPSGRERPRPNETCPTWVHDQYATTDPDGGRWPTWHHQIDPVYWCYHRHEHGSNPEAFHRDHKPLYGYSTAAHGYSQDMQEAHPGFKTYVLDDRAGNRWMITQHFGTTGLARACQRFHTVDIAVRRRSDGLLLADLHVMADYGKSLVNNTDQPFRPASCPNQADVTGSGTRKLPTQASGYVGYEPWRFDQRGNVMGLIGSFTVNTPDTVAYCNDATCSRAVQTRNTGSEHFLTPNDGFALTDPKRSSDGVFYTDDQGKKILRKGERGALRQYVRPGIPRLTLPPGGGGGHYRDLEAWGRMYTYTQTDSNPTNREGSIQPPN